MPRIDVLSLPTMAQINKLPKDYKVVSLFAGGGGSSTGYKLAGYDVVFANEFMVDACDTYRANHPKAIVDSSDVRKLTGKAILKQIGLKRGELDLLDGSPPCSPFSQSGIGEDGWSKVKGYSDKAETHQRVDDLFDHYLRLLRELQPRVFVAENVAGLVKGKATGYFVQIMEEAEAAGYNVKAAVLDAAWLGVPQYRKRLIFVGVRKDLDLEPVHPKPYPYTIPVCDALPHIRFMKRQSTMTYVPATEPNLTLTVIDGRASELGKMSCGAFVEDDKGHRRKYTIPEAITICGFPRDYVLTAKRRWQWERLARAVPPLMHYNVALDIRERILNKVHGVKKKRTDVYWGTNGKPR